MRAVVTRVRSASVEIEGRINGQIGQGFLVLLGVHADDGEREAEKIADNSSGTAVKSPEEPKPTENSTSEDIKTPVKVKIRKLHRI